MSARIERISLGLHYNPVVYRANIYSRWAWIFTTSTFKPSPWLTLHRQSLRDNDLDEFLFDVWGMGEDAIEQFLTQPLVIQALHYDDKGRVTREQNFSAEGKLISDEEVFADGSRRAYAK